MPGNASVEYGSRFLFVTLPLMSERHKDEKPLFEEEDEDGKKKKKKDDKKGKKKDKKVVKGEEAFVEKSDLLYLFHEVR